MIHRAYSMLEVKEVSEDRREIEGMATTPTADRYGDIVDPMGAVFAKQMPLLWQHRHSEPVGWATFGKPTKAGIPYKAKFAKTDKPGIVRDMLEMAWDYVRLGLVRGVSIGFKSIAHEYMEGGGLKFNEWECLELSAVTIPANSEATIAAIKSIDRKTLAAIGRSGPVMLVRSPGASGTEKAASRGAIKLIPRKRS